MPSLILPMNSSHVITGIHEKLIYMNSIWSAEKSWQINNQVLQWDKLLCLYLFSITTFFLLTMEEVECNFNSDLDSVFRCLVLSEIKQVLNVLSTVRLMFQQKIYLPLKWSCPFSVLVVWSVWNLSICTQIPTVKRLNWIPF